MKDLLKTFQVVHSLLLIGYLFVAQAGIQRVRAASLVLPSVDVCATPWKAVIRDKP